MTEGRTQLTHNSYATNDWFSWGQSLDGKHVHCIVVMDHLASTVYLRKRASEEDIEKYCPDCEVPHS